MPPTTSRSYSQPKISDSFRATSKATKPVKTTPTVHEPVTKPVPAPAVTQAKEGEHLTPNDPKFVAVARAIEADRKAPFGMF